MKIKNEKKIFDLFVADEDDVRFSTLGKPFIEENDGRVWATDGHILIMVNSNCVSCKYETRKMMGMLKVREYNCDEPLFVSYLRDAIKRCPQEPEVKIKYKLVRCPECDGEGKVESDYHAHSDGDYYVISGTCPICDGEGTIDEEEIVPTGNMMPKEDSIIKFGKGYFDWQYINIIINTCEILGIEMIKLVRTSIYDFSIIELSSDIHIAIMPLSPIAIEEEKKTAIDVYFIKQNEL